MLLSLVKLEKNFRLILLYNTKYKVVTADRKMLLIQRKFFIKTQKKLSLKFCVSTSGLKI